MSEKKYKPYVRKTPNYRTDPNPDQFAQNEGIWYTRHDDGIQRIPLAPTQEDPGANNDTKESHPAFGMISIHRSQGGSTRMFGSELNHSEYFTLTVSRASRIRSLSRNWYHDGQRIIQVNLTASQLIDMIAQQGTSGVPCTIDYTEQDLFHPNIEEESEIDIHKREVVNDLAKIATQLKEMQAKMAELVAQPKATKGDLKALQAVIDRVTMEVVSNLPFVQEQLQERMETVVNDAKAEIEAKMSATLRQIGLDVVRKDPTKLLEQGSEAPTRLALEGPKKP